MEIFVRMMNGNEHHADSSRINQYIVRITYIQNSNGECDLMVKLNEIDTQKS